MVTDQTRWQRLDLGAGPADTGSPPAVRADISPTVIPDVVVDATRPLPFASDTFEEVHCYDVVEHIPDIPALMVELHRVLRPGGTVTITTPHFSSANSFTDPTHRHHLGWRSFDYFTDDHRLGYYSTARFRIAHRAIRFRGGLVDAVTRRIARRWPDWYERRLTWLLPAWYLEFHLTAIKS